MPLHLFAAFYLLSPRTWHPLDAMHFQLYALPTRPQSFPSVTRVLCSGPKPFYYV